MQLKPFNLTLPIAEIHSVAKTHTLSLSDSLTFLVKANYGELICHWAVTRITAAEVMLSGSYLVEPV